MSAVVAGMWVMVGCTVHSGFNQATAQLNKASAVKNKVLFVVTSHDKKGSTGQPTGFYLSEVVHP